MEILGVLFSLFGKGIGVLSSGSDYMANRR